MPDPVFFKRTSAPQKTVPGCSSHEKKPSHLPPPGFLERSWYLKGRRDEMASTWWGDLKSPFSHRIKIKFAIRNILTPPFSWDPGLVRRNFDRCRSRSKPPRRCHPPHGTRGACCSICRMVAGNFEQSFGGSSKSDLESWLCLEHQPQQQLHQKQQLQPHRQQPLQQLQLQPQQHQKQLQRQQLFNFVQCQNSLSSFKL